MVERCFMVEAMVAMVWRGFVGDGFIRLLIGFLLKINQQCKRKRRGRGRGKKIEVKEVGGDIGGGKQIEEDGEREVGGGAMVARGEGWECWKY